MKTLRNGILGLGIVTMLIGCYSKERQLQHKVDSLNVELQASTKTQQTLDEVGVLLDSIDANHHSLNARMVEGTSYADYINRLREINVHIRDTQRKIDQLEKSIKNTNRASSATIKRLKAELELRSKEIISLQIDIASMREENKSLMKSMSQKDSIVSTREQLIKVKEADIASLEDLVKDINEQNTLKVANLYFAQAQALETAAQRTKFAPRKRKETKREALELYKLSLFLGKSEAQTKIDELEKELS